MILDHVNLGSDMRYLIMLLLSFTLIAVSLSSCAMTQSPTRIQSLTEEIDTLPSQAADF